MMNTSDLTTSNVNNKLSKSKRPKLRVPDNAPSANEWKEFSVQTKDMIQKGKRLRLKSIISKGLLMYIEHKDLVAQNGQTLKLDSTLKEFFKDELAKHPFQHNTITAKEINILMKDYCSNDTNINNLDSIKKYFNKLNQ